MHADEERESAAERFRRRFDRPLELIVRAPGRINIIGEHTDHQEGWVLPAAVGLYTDIAAAQRSDDRITAWSEQRGAARSWFVDRASPTRADRRDDWAAILRGVTSEYFSRDDAPSRPRGLDLLVSGTLPLGAGLSSSAALGVAFTLVLEQAIGPTLSPLDRALLAHRAETKNVGVPCGIMDPFAVVHGVRDTALLLDCRSRRHSAVALPKELGRWIVIHSGLERDLRSGDHFAERTRECRAALERLRAEAPESTPRLRSLRDVDEAWVDRLADSPRLAKRVRHVVTENTRVHTMVDALRSCDTRRIGSLLDASHASLRDDFEVSLPAIDALVTIAREEGAIGARLMGGGFGGCTLNLVPDTLATSWIESVTRRYREHTGHDARAFPIRIVDGADRI